MSSSSVAEVAAESNSRTKSKSGSGYTKSYSRSGSRSGSGYSTVNDDDERALHELENVKSNLVPELTDLKSFTAEDIRRVSRIQAVFRGHRLRRRIQALKQKSKNRTPRELGRAIELLLLVESAKHNPSNATHKDVKFQHTPGVLMFGASLRSAFRGLPTVWRSITACEKVSVIFAMFLVLCVTAYFLWFPAWVGTVLGVFFYDNQGELNITTLFGWLIVYAFVAALVDGCVDMALGYLRHRFIARQRELFGALYFSNLDVLTQEECEIMNRPLDDLGDIWFRQMPSFISHLLAAIGSFIICIVASSYKCGLMVLAAVVALFLFGLVGDIFSSIHQRSIQHIKLMQNHVRAYAASAPGAASTMRTLYEMEAYENIRAERYHTILGIVEGAIAFCTPIVFMYIAANEVGAGKMTSFSFSVGFFYFLYEIYSFYWLNKRALLFAQGGDSSAVALGMVRALDGAQTREMLKKLDEYDNDSYEERVSKFRITSRFKVPWVVIIVTAVLLFAMIAVIVATCTRDTFLRCNQQQVTCSSSLRANTAVLMLAQSFDFRSGCVFMEQPADILNLCANALDWDHNSTFPVRAVVTGWRNSRGYSGSLTAVNGGATSAILTRSLGGLSVRNATSAVLGNSGTGQVTGALDAFYIANNANTFIPPNSDVGAIYANTELAGELVSDCGKPLTTGWYQFIGLEGRVATFKVSLGSLDQAVLTLYDGTHQLQTAASVLTPLIQYSLPATGLYYVSVARAVVDTYNTPTNFTYSISYNVDLGLHPPPTGLAAGFIGQKWFTVATDFSWAASENYCSITANQALCTKLDVCARTMPGASASTDSAPYVPIANAPESWTQALVGSSCGQTVVANPTWSSFAANLRFRGSIACCNATLGLVANATGTPTWYVFLAEQNIPYTVSALALLNTPPVNIGVYGLSGQGALVTGQTIVTYTPTVTNYVLVQVSGQQGQQFTVSYTAPSVVGAI